ncbi:MAG: class I SAM-dependent methyltransferase [Actinocatenispora sp.]
MANVAQAQQWNGRGGEHFISERDRHDRMHEPLTHRLLVAAAISATDTVLDVGCGCGATTRAAARAASRGHALGVDLSAPMITEARRIADRDGSTNVTFRAVDAQTHPFVGYDVAISSFGVMFFDDPVAAFGNIGAALRPGGRLAFLCWQDAAHSAFFAVPFGAIIAHVGQPRRADDYQPGPFSLADPDRVRALLTTAGFHDIDVTGLHEPLRLGDDVADAVDYFCAIPAARSMLDTAGESTVSVVRDALTEALLPHLGADGVHLGSATWLVTAVH